LPSGELLAIAVHCNIQIYNPGTREHVTSFGDYSQSLAWMLDGTHLLSVVEYNTIHEWDQLTWEQVGHPLKGHTSTICAIAIHPSGTLVASASHDNHVHLWSLSCRQTIAIFQHSSILKCVTFSVDGKHILSGGDDGKISEWELPKQFIVPKASFHS
jgi:WD40 repeat protein